MVWDRILKFIDLHQKTTHIYHTWKQNNVHKHTNDYHSINALPFTLWFMKEIKNELGNSGEMHNYCNYVLSSGEKNLKKFDHESINEYVKKTQPIYR